jgi:hypothetical protein
MSAPSTLTIRGEIHYTTTSNILAISVPSTAIPVNFTKDQQGRVALNSANPPRAQLDIVMSNASPALIVDQQTSADIVQFMKSGVVVGGVDTNANITTTGSISAINMDMFRNRIINGDMRLQADGIQGVCGSNATTVNSLPSWTIATGLYSPSITTQQIALTGSDQATTEQSYAVEIRPANLPLGLAAYFPFEESLRDASGNGIVSTVNGTLLYVPGRVGSNALYLANEANVLASPTAAANYVAVGSSTYIFPNRFSVSVWICPTKIVAATLIAFSTNAGSASLTNSFTIFISSTTKVSSAISGVNSIAGPTAVVNTWYHVVAIYNAGSYTLYVDGTSYGSASGTFAQNGFMLGNQGTAATFPFAGYIDDLRIYNRLLTTSEITALYNQTPFAPILPSASGLPHYYPFDGALTNVGTAGGALTSSPTAVSYAPGGLVGSQCLYLANESRVVASPLAATYYATGSYTFPGTFTVSLWTMASKLVSAVTSVIFTTNSNNAPATSNIMIYFSNGTTITAGFYGGSAATAITANVNTWYHCVITYSGANTLSFYLNGTLVTANITGTLVQSNFMLGNAGITDTHPFAGTIDDLRIYNSVLTIEQIAALYYNTKSTYTTFQQTIDAGALADFKWGTNGAMPVTLTTWLKNNTLSPQSFSLSVNSTGLIAHVTFENSYLDTVGEGFLVAPRVLASTTFSNSVYKVGSYALDTTANTINGTTVSRVAYTIPPVIPLPLTLSIWMRANTTSGAAGTQYFLEIGSLTAWAVELSISTSGFLGSSFSIGSANNSAVYSSALTAATWYHICMVITPSDKYIVYLNGSPVIQVSHPVSQLTPATYSSYDGALIDILQLGAGIGTGVSDVAPFKGYLDDFRIYNRALTPAQVKALYDANASSTTQPTATNIVIPVRNFTYNTPSIPANSWQKIQAILPADSTGAWDNRPGHPGAKFSLCLGAGPSYSNVTTESWTNNTEYIGGTTQLIHYDSNNFLMASSNSVWMTGVQLEKGNMSTPFDVRPYEIEKRLIDTPFYSASLGNIGNPYTGVGSYIDAVTTNVASWFNRTNYRFTPQLSGNYYVFASALKYNDTNVSQIYIRKNGTSTCRGFMGVINQYMSFSQSTIVSMNGSNDYIDIYLSNVNASDSYPVSMSTLIIYLIS